jgi:hypothetical protein
MVPVADACVVTAGAPGMETVTVSSGSKPVPVTSVLSPATTVVGSTVMAVT